MTRGYEVKCSPYVAETLGAWLTNLYRGRDRLHYWNGYLWWISAK
jgi:hypothetical protein